MAGQRELDTGKRKLTENNGRDVKEKAPSLFQLSTFAVSLTDPMLF
jgi:hypothetical protein